MKEVNFLRNRIIFLFDILGAAIIYMLSILFVFGIHAATRNVYVFLPVALSSTASICLVYYIGGMYRVLWRYAATKDYARIAVCSVISVALSMVVTLILRYTVDSTYIRDMRDTFRLAFLMSTALAVYCSFVRMFVRAYTKLSAHHDVASREEKKKRILIVGAGVSASMLIRDMESSDDFNLNIVGIVDDNPSKVGSVFCGYPVMGNRDDIPGICHKLRVDEIFLAIPSASATDKNEIVELCTKTKAKLKIVPSLSQAINTQGGRYMPRNVQIEDLLDRQEIQLDNKMISEYIEDKVVLVTGGGGSIGSELCRQIMRFNPKKLVIVDIYENNAYDLQMDLDRLYPDNKPTVLIASIRDKLRLEAIFEEHKPYIVFHAAAHKHVPLMEDSPGEAIKNNVFGTYNVALCADKYRVKRFVMISTDKAVNPTNIMGATKRMCELVVQAMQKISDTEFVAVRFGNVLGSNGSVIPLFKKQIELGGPVTVTHKDITRFFMTIPEAAQLVLQAASYAQGGEIFVLDMGSPVRIYDLAKNIIRLSGYTPGVDIKIEVTGLRPGEKLFEELLMNEEGLSKTRHEKIFIGVPSDITMEDLKPNLDLLKQATESNDISAIKDIMEKVVPTYIKNPDLVNKSQKVHSV